MSKIRVHLGLHYYGAGNLGDDLMVAGFLEAARPAFLEQATFTCCIPHGLDCQRLRFPEIEWLPYDDDTRADCIARCDVWLGLGDTPFQATGGYTWFLDHLCREAAWCWQADVPMFYLGVGVNERAAVEVPQMRFLVEQAERIWMRDEGSAELLHRIARPGCVTAHADLAHLALAAMQFPAPEPGTLGLVLNFEDPAQFHRDDLAALVRDAEDPRVRWLAQEVRPLAGAETVLHGQLPPELRARAPLLKPDYAGAASVRALLTDWEGLDAIFTSRYHGSLVGAWIGARVAVFARSDKVSSAAAQLGVAVVPGMADTAAIRHALRAARPVERPWLLDLTARARAACEEFFALATAPRPRSERDPAAMPNALERSANGYRDNRRAEWLAVIGRQGAEVNRLRAEIDQHLHAADEFWPRLDTAENARNLAAAQLADLRRQFESMDADHAARLEVIERQGTEISRLHEEVDRHLKEAGEFWPQLDVAVNERNLLASQIEDLGAHFQRSEADRAARQEIIEHQGAEIVRLHAEVDRWLREAGELGPRLEATLHERNLLVAQMKDLHGHFQRSEADRVARLETIERQGAEIVRLHAEVDRWLREAGELGPRLEAALHERNLRAAELADLRAHFEQSEADRAARLQVIETQGDELGKLRAQLALTGSELTDLRAHYAQSETDRAARLQVIETQGNELGELRAQLTITGSELTAMHGHYKRSEADRAARLEVIESQGATLGQLQRQLAAAADEHTRLSTDADAAHAANATLTAEREQRAAERERLAAELGEVRTAHATLTGEFEGLRARKKTLDKHWTVWLLKRLRLWPL